MSDFDNDAFLRRVRWAVNRQHERGISDGSMINMALTDDAGYPSGLTPETFVALRDKGLSEVQVAAIELDFFAEALDVDPMFLLKDGIDPDAGRSIMKINGPCDMSPYIEKE